MRSPRPDRLAPTLDERVEILDRDQAPVTDAHRRQIAGRDQLPDQRPPDAEALPCLGDRHQEWLHHAVSLRVRLDTFSVSRYGPAAQIQTVRKCVQGGVRWRRLRLST